MGQWALSDMAQSLVGGIVYLKLARFGLVHNS